jgi:hypothetical protein
LSNKQNILDKTINYLSFFINSPLIRFFKQLAVNSKLHLIWLPPSYPFRQPPTILKHPAHRASSPMMVGSGVLQQFSLFSTEGKRKAFFFW